MKKTGAKKFVALFLMLCITLTIISPIASAANTVPVNYGNDTYIRQIEGGSFFADKTQDRTVAIITEDTTHTIYASIMYSNEIGSVHQWIIKDYPEKFRADDIRFWNNVILYAEKNMDKASLVSVTYEEKPLNSPVPASSAGADLLEQLEKLEGAGYGAKRIEFRMIEGHKYNMYESKELSIEKKGTFSWSDGTTIASIAVGIVGLATAGTAATVCGVLGLAFTGLGLIVPAGKVNKYYCSAFYTRYIRVDDGTKQYAHAYKLIQYTAVEDASLNSKGRAAILEESRYEGYDGNQSKQYFLSGIYDSAYKFYTGNW